MVGRPFWVSRLEQAWAQAPIVWLTGPRRVGKTVLSRSLSQAAYLNCDLPSVAARLQDPETFYRSLTRATVVFDEIHQIVDPSRVLKIAADAFPRLKVLATGSSTFAATQKFRDSLTGRKRVVELVPVLHQELHAFAVADLVERLRLGGLPPVLLGAQSPDDFFPEWLDSYFARDVQELFRLEKRAAFLKLLQLLMLQSGGLLDVTRLAAASGISRPTAATWLNVYEVTHTVRIIRPFSKRGRREIVAQPKVYGFDTGLICHARGWDRLRPDDCGILWEHVVLESLVAYGVMPQYWRDKQQREVDFIVPQGRDAVDAVECKWRADSLDARGLLAFRALYPKGRNIVVSPVEEPYERRIGELRVTVLPPGQLGRLVSGRRG